MYNLSIKDPVDTIEMKISGTIEIILKDIAHLQAIGKLVDLPMPWTNPFTGRFAYVNTIGIEGASLTGTEEEVVDNMIDLLEDEINNTFGIYVKDRLIATRAVEIIEEPTEEIIEEPVKIIQPPVTKQVIFNVKKENYMTNDEFGELKIISSPNDDIGFIFDDEYDDTNLITDEYEEDEFRGKEEFSTEEFLNYPEVKQSNEKEQSNGTLDAETIGEYTTSLPSPSNDTFYKKNKVPYYSQYDSRWSRVIYGLTNDKKFIEDPITPESRTTVYGSYEGSSYTIKCDHKNGKVGWSDISTSGCGITSLAMVCNYWVAKNNKNTYTTPIKMAKLSTKSNGRPGPPCNGTNMYELAKNGNSKLIEGFGFKLENVNADEAKSYIKDGHPVIWGCKNGKAKNSGGSYKSYSGHFMVITEYRNGKFYINDPGNNSSKGCAYTENFSDISGGSSYFFVSKPV